MLRAGIVGFGGMGQRHLRAYQGTGCEVVAICDVAPERVAAVQPAFPLERVYSDYREMLARECLDILSVASNGPTHAGIAIEAMNAGVGRVLCEKPIGTSLPAAEDVIQAVRRTGARLAVNHIRRWSEPYRRLRQHFERGVWGDLRHVYFHSGSTGLGNFVIHAFDLMRYLTGSEPAWAMGALDRTGTPNPRGRQFVDPAGFGTVVFANGARGFVDSSEDTGVQYLFTFATTHARIIVDELNGVWSVRARALADRSAPLTRYALPLEPEAFDGGPFDIVSLTQAAIVELAGDGALSCTAEDGLRSLEMVIAFHDSDERGHARTDFPLTGAARQRKVEIA